VEDKGPNSYIGVHAAELDRQATPNVMLFHIASTADWKPECASYAPAGLLTEGFVHCSTSDQVARVANELFAGREDLLLLRIDPNRVSA
jgi:uncharacterized protein (DUF952 family)